MKPKILVAALVGVLVAGATVGTIAIASSSGSSSSKKAKLELRKGKLGRFIVDARGMTLYLFEKDKHGKSACSGACAKVWAPYETSGKPIAGPGLSRAKIGTTKRAGGATQVTYGGHPLYHYDDDHKAGQIEGEGSKAFGAEWYIVAPSGKKIDKS